MEKEEIENIEKIKKMLNFTTEGTSLRINNEISKLLLKYINDLEQSNKILDTECNRLEKKEFILDKVIDIVKIIIKRTETELMYGTKDMLEDLQEILKISEGG